MPDFFDIDQNNSVSETDKVPCKYIDKLRQLNISTRKVVIVAVVICAVIGTFYACQYVYKAASKALSNHIQENVLYVTDYLQQRVDNLEEEVAKSRKIYVYNLQEAVAKSDMIKIKENFEKNVKALNKEIEEARKKIQKLEKSNVKKDFAELYLRSLRLKKDNMLKDHENALQNAADDINRALNQIIKEKKIPAIFKADTIAYSSDNVVDVTPEVINLLSK